MRRLRESRLGEKPLVVATEVAARGIDVPDFTCNPTHTRTRTRTRTRTPAPLTIPLRSDVTPSRE